MKRFSFTIFCLFLALGVSSQTVTVSKQPMTLMDEKAQGFQTELDGKKDEVNSALSSFLKDTGKAKSNGDMLVLKEPTVGGTLYTGGILYAFASESGEKSKVWLGLIGNQWEVNDIEIVNKELEQLVYRFGVKYYKDKIQLQIDESVRAADAVERQQQRLVNENKTLNNRLTNNAQQQVQLEKSLQEAKLEDLVLKQKIENNKRAQDSVAQAGVQIKKVIELHKERQKKVN